MLESVTSAANPLVKDVRRAIARGGLTSEGWCIAETFHLFEEALRSGAAIRTVLAAESARTFVESSARAFRTVILPDALFQSISATETAQGVMTLIEPRRWTLPDLLRAPVLMVILDEVQDPGNAGAIVRAAEAFGATGVVFPKGTAGPYNPKTIRASAGSLFRLPVLYGMDAACVRSELLSRGIAVFAAMPAHSGAMTIGDSDLTSGCAIVIGNEARGASSEWRSIAQTVAIPTNGVESLNAAVAGGILLYEARRQRGRL